MGLMNNLTFEEIKKRMEEIKKTPTRKDNVKFKFTSEQIQSSWRKVTTVNGKSK